METSDLSNDKIARQELIELSERLDERTEVMSGGFEHLDDFQAVLQYGERALPVLLERMRREDGEWWEMQAVLTIAAQYDQPIEFPEEVRGRYDEVKALIIDWGKDQGYISREDLTAEPKE